MREGYSEYTSVLTHLYQTQELEIVTQHKLQKHIVLALRTIPRTVIFHTCSECRSTAAVSFLVFCVYVLGDLFEAFNNITQSMD